MGSQQVHDEADVDIFWIAEFLLRRWWILVIASLLGGTVGLVVAFATPPKFEASGLLRSGRVIEEDVEASTALLDRLQSPSIYSQGSLKACGLDEAKRLVAALSPNIPRNSTFVDVRVRMSSAEAAEKCLSAVHLDVVASERPLFDAKLSKARSDLDILKRELVAAQSRRERELAFYNNRLDSGDMILERLDAFLSETPEQRMKTELQSDQLSGSLFATSLLLKDAEARYLFIAVDTLQKKIENRIQYTEDEFSGFEIKVNSAISKLAPPFTEEATFVTPVFTSNVTPSKLRVLIIGLLIGTFAGTALLALQYFYILLRKKRASTTSV